MKKLIFTVIVLFLGVSLNNNSRIFAHCEIPCGIYDDQTRVKLLLEHMTTIEKSMNQINELSKADVINYNQLVRWVNNKEEHATKIQDIVSQYFLHQRVKIKEATDEAAFSKYITQLTALHSVQVNAMKAKQTTDLSYIKKMQDALHAFEKSYFEGEHKH